ncbi:alkaline phosphatase synthesis sensor protein PhoR [Clostridium magnum DSM 2767]|uniref:histidine kinase n=2 Tax=Clostridium magnum TaxID=33954 RepID=A0A162UY69_9CLOT|nr:alkaline phosphatase synthesis sensor protein PhoR [Clostridium magnum DSM 2767]SHI22442.1 two-component system, OmpR family, phosphate regulon sensor histidine kinase PhoR [Clostridium magnum DSM 2767]
MIKMKKKLMFSMLSTLLFSLTIMTILFVVIENQEYLENMKRTLKVNNELIINVLKNEKLEDRRIFFKNNFTNEMIRETYIDKNGIVLSDSIADSKTMDNHNSRKEVIDARQYGEGFSIRYSITTGYSTLYFATVFEDGFVVRSAITMQTIKGIESNYFKYYMLIMFFSVSISIIFASKMSQSIVKPIKDLEFTTDKIAEGEFNRRVRIVSNDEIGHLSMTFNNMAGIIQNILRDSLDKQNKLEAILKSMDSGVIAVDKGHRVIMINPYAKKIFGINKDIIGQNLMNNIRDFEFDDIFDSTKEDSREMKILWPKERVLRIRTADIINEGEKIGTVAVVQDITDVRKLENIRSQFVANVSHELKTPLTSIKGFAETLKYVDDPINRKKFLSIIEDEANRLTRLINDILTLSHIENNIEGKKYEFKVSDIVKDVYNLMKHTAEKKNIEIIIGEESSSILNGDSDRFKQMLINLVDNAIKYSDNNGKIVIRTKCENEDFFISVEDNGVGIPKEHLGRLFERFYRVDKARSRAQGGTGLGLAIVKYIVVGFNGTIQVESEVGKGSKFTVKIPIEKDKED